MNENFDNLPFKNEAVEMRLWNYIDDTSDATEKAIIEKLIAENAVWRAKYAELLELHALVQASELEEPSMRFTKNVMEEIAKFYIAPAAKNYINKKVIWSIGVFFITLIASFLVYAIAQVNWSEGTSDNIVGIDFTKVDYSKMFNNNLLNGFMMLNIVFGLAILDRYLAGKRNKLIQKS